MDTIWGKRYVYQRVDLDEETLQEIARQTGGKYFRATDTASLERIYQEIDSLEKRKIREQGYACWEELFPWFVLPAFGLLLVDFVLERTFLRRIP